ncbi:hypothetical protein TNCV_328691 [Trichonephila clavipes]|nr:hypothetical protein TNCV_328691 [Trichonephila clavipes]
MGLFVTLRDKQDGGFGLVKRIRYNKTPGRPSYGQKLQMTSSRISAHEAFYSASSTTRLPGGIFQNLRNSIQR